jgi:hypothetical protein
MILSENWPRELFEKTDDSQSILFAFRADIQKSGRGQR